MTKAEHWGPVEAAWPTPDSELEDIEIGFRPSWWLVVSDLTNDDFGGVLMLTSQIAEATRELDVPYPDEWKSEMWS